MLTVNHLVTSGTFSLDGGTWDVDNNVWVLGDDAECVVIDAPHDAGAILSAVGPRRLTAILCTHAHDDHVDAAAALAEATRAPIWLHPADRELWDQTYRDRRRHHGAAHARAFARRRVLPPALPALAVQRRYVVRRRTRRDRALLLRFRHDHRLDA